MKVPRSIQPLQRVMNKKCRLCGEDFELHQGYSQLHGKTVFFCGNCGYVTSDLEDFLDFDRELVKLSDVYAEIDEKIDGYRRAISAIKGTSKESDEYDYQYAIRVLQETKLKISKLIPCVVD